jgi:hypothetical protein
MRTRNPSFDNEIISRSIVNGNRANLIFLLSFRGFYYNEYSPFLVIRAAFSPTIMGIGIQTKRFLYQIRIQPHRAKN